MLWKILLTLYLTGIGVFILFGWKFKASKVLVNDEPITWPLIIFTSLTWPIWFVVSLLQKEDERSTTDGSSENE